MPDQVYHISDDDGLITVQLDDVVDVPGLQQTASLILDDADYHPEIPLLVDLRGTRLCLEKDHLEAFNRFVIASYGANRASIAVVIDTDLRRTICAAVYWLVCALDRTELFDDYDQALKWLIRREFAVASAQSR